MTFRIAGKITSLFLFAIIAADRDGYRGFAEVTFSAFLSTVREITVQCPLAPPGRGQGEGAESASVISRTVLSASKARHLLHPSPAFAPEQFGVAGFRSYQADRRLVAIELPARISRPRLNLIPNTVTEESMADQQQTTNWPDLAIGLYDRLTGRNAEITSEFQDMHIKIPSGTGPNAEHAEWVLSGGLSIRTRDGNTAPN